MNTCSSTGEKLSEVQKFVIHLKGSHVVVYTVYIARNFHRLNFLQIGRFWIFADNIFAVASAPRPCPLFASTV